MKSQILIVSAVFPPEPVVSASRSYELAISLGKVHQVKVLTPRPSRPYGYNFQGKIAKNSGYEHITLNSFIYPRSRILGRLTESYSFGKHVSKYIKQNQDKIGCIFIGAWPLLAQRQIVKAAVKYSIPSILSVQDIYPESLIAKLPVFKKLAYATLLPIDRYSLKNSRKIITISQRMKDYLASTRGVNVDTIELVNNWAKTNTTFNKNPIHIHRNDSKPFTFMYLGSLSPTASIDELIKAFCFRPIKNSRLIIAGNGSERSSLMKLADKHIESNIEFLDCGQEEAINCQQKADVLLLSLKKGTAHYALPSKLASYLISSKPVIASVDSDSESARIIETAKCGWVCPPANVEQLAKIMEDITKLPHLQLINFGENGYKYAIRHFGKEENLTKLVNIVNDTFKCD